MADLIYVFRLHDKIATQLSIPIWGVASTKRIDFKDSATPEQRTQAQTIVDGWETLTPLATKNTIIANGVDTTNITVNGLTTFQYKIYSGDEIINSGTINDGTLELTSIVAGTLLIEISSGNNNGFIEIEATND